MQRRSIAILGLAMLMLAIPGIVGAQPARTIGTNGLEQATAIQTWGPNV
jgi:UDP-N-acetylenolpyruvoylglucosamine reductase